MYEAVTAHPEGDSTVARMALTAGEHGYDGIVVRNAGDRMATYDRAAIRAEYDVDVVEGVEITAEDPSSASGYLGHHRQKRTIVAVRGGTAAMNRFAVEQPAVDVLAYPFGGLAAGNAAQGDVDHVLAKTAAENGVRIEVSLAPLLRTNGGTRVRAIQSLRRLVELVEHFETPYVVTAGPTGHLGVRAPRELAALGDVIGLSNEQVEAGLTEWRAIAERNRTRQSAAFVEPGVYRCDRE